MLSEQERIDIKSAMERTMAELQVKIKEYRELTKPIAPENAIGRVSRMDAINNKSVNEAALRQAEAKLQKLKKKKKKVEDPTFGVCQRCGNPIPVGRIMLMPESNRCVRCAH